MSDRNPAVKCRQGCRHRGVRIAVHQHNVRPRRCDDTRHVLHDLRRNFGEALRLLHHPQVVVHRNVEKLQHLIEHRVVLTCHADLDLEQRVLRTDLRNRSHLYGLRTRAHNDQQPFQNRVPGFVVNCDKVASPFAVVRSISIISISARADSAILRNVTWSVASRITCSRKT